MKKKLYIFLDSEHIGGSEIDLLNLVHFLRDYFEVSFILSAKSNDFISNFTGYKIISAPRAVLVTDFFRVLVFILKNAQIFCNDSKIIFWCHHFDSNRILQICNFAKKKKSTIAYRSNLDYNIFFGNRKLAKMIFTFFQSKYRFVFCGESMRRDFADYFSANLNIKHINNGRSILTHYSDLEKLRAIQKCDGDVQDIVVVSRIVKEKRIDVIIEAIALLSKSRRDFHVKIVGDGEHVNDLRELVKSHHLEEKITFLGYQKDVNAILLKSSLYVSASSLEGLPGSVIEAMSCGCLTICSNIPPHVELLKSGTLGLLFETDSVFDLYNNFMKALDMDYFEKNRIVTEAFETVKLEYNSESQFEIWRKHLDEI